MRLLIKGGHIVNEGRTSDGFIVIEDGNIIEITKQQPEASFDETIDASGCYVLPGVIDDHVHFREPGLTAKADIDTESRAAAAGGVTSYFDMPNCVPQTRHWKRNSPWPVRKATSTIRSFLVLPTTIATLMPSCLLSAFLA